MSKQFVLVVCGAGTLTSVMASQGIEEGLKKRGIKNVKVEAGRIDDVQRHKNEISVLVSTMKIREEHDFPVLNAISFITGDEDGQQEVIDEVAKILE